MFILLQKEKDDYDYTSGTQRTCWWYNFMETRESIENIVAIPKRSRRYYVSWGWDEEKTIFYVFKRLYQKMWEIILQNKAQDALNYLKKYEISVFNTIISALKQLESKWWNRDKLKDIGNEIKRIRVWRRRILCTSKKDIYVWIIAVEKDTDKDYTKRKEYIIKNIKLFKQ